MADEMTPSAKRALNEVTDLLNEGDFVLGDFPELQTLCRSIWTSEDPAVIERIRWVGIAIADLLFYAADFREHVRKVLHDADAMPVTISALRDQNERMLDRIYNGIELGRNMGLRMASSKGGGPKRFRCASAPSSVALDLFYAMEEYIIPEEDAERRAWFLETLEMEIRELDRESPDFLKELERLEFHAALASLPKLTQGTYFKWAEVGARLLVDFPDWGDDYLSDNTIPTIPEEWQGKAANRKGKLGALRDIVRKELETGFKGLASS